MDARPLPRPARVPSLDGIRAIAVALVWISHMYNTNGVVAALGPIGVRIFFVVSGFIITKLLLDECEAAGRVSLTAFYLRRTYRIFPACYAYVACIAVLAAVGVAKGLQPRDLLVSVTYTTNYAPAIHWSVEHLWSLAVEEQFYLIWPLLFVVLPRRTATRVLFAVIALAPLSRVLTYHLIGAGSGRVDHMFHTVADSLATGCVLALGMDTYRQTKAYRALPSPLICTWLVVVIAAAAGFQQSHRVAYYVFGLTVLNVSIALFVLRVTEGQGRIAAALNSRAMVSVGLVSYSLYLWQQPFLYPFAHPNAVQRFPVNLVGAIVAALASYHFIEKPIRRLGTRFAARPNGRVGPHAATDRRVGLQPQTPPGM